MTWTFEKRGGKLLYPKSKTNKKNNEVYSKEDRSARLVNSDKVCTFLKTIDFTSWSLICRVNGASSIDNSLDRFTRTNDWSNTPSAKSTNNSSYFSRQYLGRFSCQIIISLYSSLNIYFTGFYINTTVSFAKILDIYS